MLHSRDMRIILILIVFMFVPLGYAHAIFYNNTETIEVGDGSLPAPSPDSTTDTGNSGGGTTNAPTTQNPPATTGDETSDSEDPDASSDPSGDDEDAEDANEVSVVEALIQAGALSGVNGSGGEGSSNETSAASFSVRIIGEKVRQALYADIDLREILTYWRKGKGKASGSELGLIAASTALRDSNVQEVAFTASSYEIVYRSRGYLLAIIPWSFPVRVMVIPSAPTIDERVSVKLPWYRFFVRKFFTVNGLQKDIDQLLTKTKNEITDSDIDETMLLFEATAEFLRTKVGTVADSVLLGEPQ